MALTAAADRKPPLIGREHPRLAPPTPARSQIKDFTRTARDIGVNFLPWQTFVGRYLYATAPGGRWLYPEVAAIVARQNGKTEIIRPHIIHRLAMGRNVLHVAQVRDLPRRMFFQMIPFVEELYPDARFRRGTGQEKIEIPGGGSYTITAATGPGPRGLTIDDLIVDELREIDEEFIGAAVPTMSASLNPQILYLSNAGSEESVSLNAVRARADTDPALAYLEWSAGPDRAVDDVEGWAEANPSIGHFPALLDNLTRMYRSHRLGGTMAHFETENLCRWVVTIRERLIDDADWVACSAPLSRPVRPALGVSLDPEGRRASIALAWRRPDGRIGLRSVENFNGQPVDTDDVGVVLKDLELRHNAQVGFDPLTDSELIKYVRKGHGVTVSGQKYAAASALFALTVSSRRLAWADCDAVTDDLTWTARKPDGNDGSYHAVRAKDDHPIPAALAAIRAVWLASQPRSEGRLVVR